MKTAIIGHRGVGKSSLLDRIQKYFADANRTVHCFDLDREIEKRHARAVSDIFEKDGEAAFRKIEREIFQALDLETKGLDGEVYLVLGAGFEPQEIPESWRALWVRRPTDTNGRIFLDRPRLNAALSPLDEYRERYEIRDPKFRARADEVLILDEGIENEDAAERAFFLGQVRDLQGALTLFPSDFRHRDKLEWRLKQRMKWGLRWFELRDDLLSLEQLEEAIRILPDEKILLSLRDPQKKESSVRLIEKHGLCFDWPMEFGVCDIGDPKFLSLHERKDHESLKDVFAKLPSELPDLAVLKVAVPIRSFDEIWAGHLWACEDLHTRVFLPMSSDGRWAWYRLFMASQYLLNFFRESDGSILDQPTLLQWQRRREIERLSKPFAPFSAILGNPVAHSRTPMEQAEFFHQRGASVFSIRMSEEEWKSGALDIIQKLGLRWASVTSPLKNLAHEKCQVRDELSDSLGAINTLLWNESQGFWQGTNTDVIGLQDLLKESSGGDLARLGKIAVWGGGGTLNVISKAVPYAQFFSVRTQENRNSQSVRASDYRPDTLLWAGTRPVSHVPPPEAWSPSLVIDLNYAENSLGRAYALKVGAKYVSGLLMFRSQASAQRAFWKDQGESNVVS